MAVVPEVPVDSTDRAPGPVADAERPAWDEAEASVEAEVLVGVVFAAVGGAGSTT